MKVKRDKRIEFTSISIPSTLFKKLEKHIDGTGFPSVSGYVAFVMRTILSEGGNTKADYEAEMVKKRLRELGYL
jgi:metal-responsive CopG/Arc/MetJ family transcriptional regulator